MISRYAGKKAAIYRWSLRSIFFLACLLQNVSLYSLQAEAALLDSLPGLRGKAGDTAKAAGTGSGSSVTQGVVAELQKNVADAVSNVPVVSDVVQSGGKEAPAPASTNASDKGATSPAAASAPATAPVQASAPSPVPPSASAPAPSPVPPSASAPAPPAPTPAPASAGKSSGSGLLPELQVKTPSVSVETPVLKVDIPSVEAKITTNPAPQASSKPAETEAKAPAVAPPASPSAGKSSGGGLLPELQVKTPSVSVETPVLKAEVPSVEAKVTTDQTPQASVNLPAVKVETPVVQVKTPSVQAEVPLTPDRPPYIKVETPAVQVKTPVADIQVPSVPVIIQPGRPQLPPPIDDGKNEGGQVKVPPRGAGSERANNPPAESPKPKPVPSEIPSDSGVTTAPATKTGHVNEEQDSSNPAKPEQLTADPVNTEPVSAKRISPKLADEGTAAVHLAGGSENTSLLRPETAAPAEAAATGLPQTAPEPDRSSVSYEPSIPNTSMGQPKGVTKQPVTGPPEHSAPTKPWYTARSIYSSSGSTGASTSVSIGPGSGPSPQNAGFLLPDPLLQPPKFTNQNYQRSQLLGTNQWSKPPPGQPPRYSFFSSAA